MKVKEALYNWFKRDLLEPEKVPTLMEIIMDQRLEINQLKMEVMNLQRKMKLPF
jgi:hypothetical protein